MSGGTIFTSNQIAQMTAPMAAPISSFAANPFFDQAVGGAMSRIGSVGGAVLQGGMGLLGVDPFSLGMSAFSGAFRGGAGLAGAGMAGLGAAAAVGVPMMAAGYAGNQMFTGMQQQQQLNSTLRQNYPFMGPNGQGFNRTQMGDIGGALREMTHSFGPGGEMASYRELTALAGQMGQMGMAKGVREVQDFTKKFKEMVEAAKTMARDLGTTLEGATQAMQSMRNSGIFKAADQVKFTGMARNTSLASGVAMTEVMGMASIGSQLSRSVGGTGMQGAFAGMKAIGTIGTANQIGAISDEDIYNATGLTGASGRQAYATNMLSADASFLKTSRGRRLLAAMAGKNGQLNEDLAGEFASGGFSIGRTMELDSQNLSKIGRANFIRNEGRLRGAVLERFGGNVNVMSLMGWAGGKGIDINDMDDRSMLFAQRQLGMGRDEFETALKMAQNLPGIMLEQANRQRDDSYMRQRADYQKTHGVQGLRTKFDHAREQINSKLQQAGADIMNSAEDMLERWVNEISGQYYRHVSAGVDQAISGAMKGDMSKASGVFGGSSGMVKMPGQTGGPLASQGGMLRSLGSKIGFGLTGSELSSAGYDIGWMASDKDMKYKLGQIQAGQSAAMGTVSGKDLASMSSMKDQFGAFFAFGSQGAKGDQLNKSFESMLADQAKGGNQQAAALLKRFHSGDAATQASIMHAASTMSGGSFDEVALRLGRGQLNPGQLNLGGTFASEGERREAFFKAFTGNDLRSSAGQAVSKWGSRAMMAGGALVAMTGVGALVGAGMIAKGAAAGAASGAYYEGNETDQQLAGFLTGDGFSDLAKQALSSDAATRTKFRENAIKMGRGIGTNAGTRTGLGMLSAASAYIEASMKGEVSEDQAAALLKQYGVTNYKGKASDMLKRFIGASSQMVDTSAKEARIAANEKLSSYARADLDAIQNLGMGTVGADGSIQLSALGKGNLASLSSTQQDVVNKTLGLIKEGSALGPEGDTLGYLGKQAALEGQISSMSVADQRKLAQYYRKMGWGSQASKIEAKAMMVERTKATLAKKGTVATLAQELGVDDPGAVKDVQSLISKGSTEEAVNVLMSHAGLTSKGTREGITAALKGGTDKEAIAKAIQGVKGSEEFSQKQAAAAKDKQEKDNPLLAEVRDLMKQMKDGTDNVVKNTKASNNYLSALSSADSFGGKDKKP